MVPVRVASDISCIVLNPLSSTVNRERLCYFLLEMVKTRAYDMQTPKDSACCCDAGVTMKTHKTIEHRQAKESPPEPRRQIEFILGATNICLDIVDSGFTLRYVDPEWAKAYGDWTGRKCYDYFMGRSAPCPGCRIPKALETKRATVTEGVLIKENNRPVQVTSIPYQDENDEWLVAEVNVDIAERKKAEEALRANNERLETIFEQSPVGIGFSRDGVVLDANPAFLRMFGYGEIAELRGKPLTDLIAWQCSVEIIDRLLCRAQGEAAESTYEFVGLRKDGSQFPFLVAGKRIDIPDDPLTIAFFTDLTEYKQAGAELRQRRQELLHMERVQTMGQLASSLAHEINQPLAGILSNAQAAQRLLKKEAPDLKQIREILADIVADDKRAGEVIQRLRQLLRKEQPERKLLDVNDVVATVVSIVRNEAVVHNVSLRTELAEGLPQVCADRIQIEQVILNLVLNAEQAMASMGPHERSIVASTVPDTREGVVVSVRDTGSGIAKEIMDRIFEPFFTMKPYRLGMGLPICRSIVTAHGGRIWVENNPGGGARVCFSLPAEEGGGIADCGASERGARKSERGTSERGIRKEER